MSFEPLPPASLAPGSRLGPYEVAERIGAGGMGEVYRARDSRLEREVALKVLPASRSASPESLRRFEQEARAAGALDHPNVLVVHDVGRHDGVEYLVTELLDGQTLRQRLERGPLPVRKALEVAAQLARGLAAAHAKRIVHRDLKPDNTKTNRRASSGWPTFPPMAAGRPRPSPSRSQPAGRPTAGTSCTKPPCGLAATTGTAAAST